MKLNLLQNLTLRCMHAFKTFTVVHIVSQNECTDHILPRCLFSLVHCELIFSSTPSIISQQLSSRWIDCFVPTKECRKGKHSLYADNKDNFQKAYRPVFLRMRIHASAESTQRMAKALRSLYICAGLSRPLLFAHVIIWAA